MIFSPFLSIDHSCDETLKWSKKQLVQAGLRPVQTFDLHAARIGSHNYPCPNHGTDECDCQLLILLVYGDSDNPETLILHGSDGQTCFSIADNPSQRVDKKLVASIKNALDTKAAVSI